MSRRINIFVPPISSFPDLNLLGGYGLQDRIDLPKTSSKGHQRGVDMDVLDDRESHFLYVIDSKGRLLEHMRYFGDDYRSALRESVADEPGSAGVSDPEPEVSLNLPVQQSTSPTVSPPTASMEHLDTPCSCRQ